MFQHIDAAQLLALPQTAPTRLGKGAILARYVPPWLRSTTTSSCPYDDVVFLWTSIDRAPSASPLQEEGGRVALLRLSFQLPRAACAVFAIVRAAPTHPVHKNVCRSRGLLARGRAFLDSDRSVRPLQGPRVGAVCFRHFRHRGAGVPIDDGSAYPNGTGHQRSCDLCAGALLY